MRISKRHGLIFGGDFFFGGGGMGLEIFLKIKEVTHSSFFQTFRQCVFISIYYFLAKCERRNKKKKKKSWIISIKQMKNS